MPRRLLLLLAALTALALTSLAGIATTAVSGVGAQNRVWAVQTPPPSLVGLQATKSACTHQGLTASAVGLAAGFCTAAEGTGAASRVFWSGSRDAKAAAEQFATENGGQTLEMTVRGQQLEASNLEWTAAKPQWDAASADFAAGATGDVHVFQAAEGVRLGSAWANFEYPILSENPSVNLIFPTVGGG